jgi:ferritin-like protein
VLSDEFLAAEFYKLAELAMKGNKQHRLSEIAHENAEDELEDHFKNLSEWMQSKGIKVVTNHDEMLDITNGSVFTVEDGDSTSDIVDKLIQSEEEAIEAYEDLIPDTDLDLRVMLCGFLKDEREHLKALTDARDEMGGSRYDGEDKPKHTIYESSEEDVKFRVYDIDWDTDGEDVDLPDEVVVTVPGDVYADAGSSSYISDWLSDEYGFCHNGFLIDEI